MTEEATEKQDAHNRGPHGMTNKIVSAFLNSNLPVVLTILSAALGLTAILATPREEDPQIVVPIADVYVNFPGHSAREVEQLVSNPLERILYQIDGVEYVYSMSKRDQAIITVRFYVGQDRERSLVKIFKKINENVDIVPKGVTGWVVKPVEIDDVPIVTFALTARPGENADEYTLRRVGEELVERLAAVPDVSRAYVVGGRPRIVNVYLNADVMKSHGIGPVEIQEALIGANVMLKAGEFTRNDKVFQVDAGRSICRPEELGNIVVATAGDRPVFLRQVAKVEDGPAEPVDYVRHGWGQAAGKDHRIGVAGSSLFGAESPEADRNNNASPAVAIAISKKKGSNAVAVAKDVLQNARSLAATILPDNMELVVTRNSGLSSNDKVNDLIEALAVALAFVVAVLTIGLGWRESLIVALAVPVVFGLTLAINLFSGLTINRVTLFALILSLGLLVDDPIVDVENIARHFSLAGRASRSIVLDAVSEIRPPLIAATLAVIVSFLPLSFITGMMGPYMRPMAVNVPVAMVMSMIVAFTITPWLTFHVLKKRYSFQPGQSLIPGSNGHSSSNSGAGLIDYIFRPLISPLLVGKRRAWMFLAATGLLMILAVALAATRSVPLKMLPYGNKDQLQLVLDFDEGTTLERADAAVREFEAYLRTVPEVADFTSFTGTSSPMDFNGMVRHYYLRSGQNVADIAVNLADRKMRPQQTHAIGLRIRDELTAIAVRNGANLKIVESPPGPPVLATVVAEVYGRPDNSYQDLMAAARTVRQRMELEPGVADVDDTIEALHERLVFEVDQEKASLSGVSADQIAQTMQICLTGRQAGAVHIESERKPLAIELRLARADRSDRQALGAIAVRSKSGSMVQISELGKWKNSRADQTIYHKNLQPVVYVFGESVGRAPAEVVIDIKTDRKNISADESAAKKPQPSSAVQSGCSTCSRPGEGAACPASCPTTSQASSQSAEIVEPPLLNHSGYVASGQARPVGERSYVSCGGGLGWAVPDGIRIDFAGEGEWQMTLDVFRDMGLAFAAALVAIYVILVAQTGSFLIPVVVMMAIPLTIIGIMPGFWILNGIAGGSVGGYPDPICFTATAMIGMIALAGIVTRGSIIIVDFIHLSLAAGKDLKQAIIESCTVRLRPILLTAATAMLSALPIAADPIFSGLAWALVFGLIASTAFTLFVIPLVYWLVYANKPGHGVPVKNSDE